jgi:hypothetical protein
VSLKFYAAQKQSTHSSPSDNSPRLGRRRALRRFVEIHKFYSIGPAQRTNNQGKSRGPPPEERTRVANAMRADIVDKRVSIEGLNGLKQEALAAQYRTGRGAAVQALEEVRSEFHVDD